MDDFNNKSKGSNGTKWFWVLFWQFAVPFALSLSSISLTYAYKYKDFSIRNLHVFFGLLTLCVFLSFIFIFVSLILIIFFNNRDKKLLATKLIGPVLTIFVFLLIVPEISTINTNYQKARYILSEDAKNIDRICKSEQICPEIPNGWHVSKEGSVVRDLPIPPGKHWYRNSRSLNSSGFGQGVKQDLISFEITLTSPQQCFEVFSGGVDDELEHFWWGGSCDYAFNGGGPSIRPFDLGD